MHLHVLVRMSCKQYKCSLSPKALSTINSEEDAEMALQLSSSLTQALLAYRIKTVPTVSSLSLTQIH